MPARSTHAHAEHTPIAHGERRSDPGDKVSTETKRPSGMLHRDSVVPVRDARVLQGSLVHLT